MKLLDKIRPENRLVVFAIAGFFAWYTITWLIENGILRSEVATVTYVDEADSAVQSTITDQLNVIESQGIERQLTEMGKARCDPTQMRHDSIWNDLRRRFEKKRGKAYQHPDCAR